MWENTAAAFPIQGRRLVPPVELFKSSFSLNSAFKHLMPFFCLLRWGQISKGLFNCLLWLLIKSQNCVERNFPRGSNPLPYIPIHRAASSNVLSKRGRDVKHQRPSVERVSWVFFFLSLYQPEGCTDQHTKHCTLIGQNKPSELHLSTFQVRWEEQHWSFFNAWPFLKSLCLIYLLNIKSTAIIPSSVLKVATVTQKGRSMFSFFLGAVLWIVRAVILSLFCRAYVG